MSYIFQRGIGQADWFYGIPPKNPADVPNYNDPGTAQPTPIVEASAAPVPSTENPAPSAEVVSAPAPAPAPEMEEEEEDFGLPSWADKQTLLIVGGVVGVGLFLWAIV